MTTEIAPNHASGPRPAPPGRASARSPAHRAGCRSTCVKHGLLIAPARDALPADLDGGQLAAAEQRDLPRPGHPGRRTCRSRTTERLERAERAVQPLPAELGDRGRSARSSATWSPARWRRTRSPGWSSAARSSGSRSCCSRIMLPIHVVIVPQYILFSQLGLDQHVPAADRAEAAGHRRVLRLPDGAVHPRHPARAGRGGPDRRLRHGRDLPADHPAADGARRWRPPRSSRSSGPGTTSSAS